MDERRKETGIDGCVVDLMPIFGDEIGGVMHILPGGTTNPEWYANAPIHDVYSFFSAKPNALRGGHYHPVLNEMFVTMSGTALWILSDFRETSPTYKKTVALILGIDTPNNPHDIPDYTRATTKKLARLTVPAGVYHAIAPLSTEGFTAIALGTTPYNKEDYVYPTVEEVPDMKAILETFSINPL